jgi:hypothetical protein
MRLLLFFFIIFSSVAHSQNPITVVITAVPDRYTAAQYANSLAAYRAQFPSEFVWDAKDGTFWYAYRTRSACPPDYPNGVIPSCTLAPEDPYACPENQARFSVDNQASFCGSGSCSELVDVIIGSNADGSCVDTRNNFPIGGTCGDNSLVCWTTTDDTILPLVTSLDTPITSNTGGLLQPPPDVITDNDVQIIDDGATTITNTETTVEAPNGDTVTEKTTTTTNNTTGQSTTQITTKTTNENGDVTISGFTKSEENTGEEGPDRLSSGGDSCTVPPSCSGDAIDCGTQKQVWLNRCAADESIGDILSCSSSFECDGDPIACAARKLQNDNYCTIAQYSGQTAESVFSTAGLTSIDDMDSGSALSGVTQDIGGDVSGLVSSISSAGDNVNAACPAPIVVSFGHLGNFEVSYIGVCGLAEITRPILLFFSVFYSMFGLVQVLRGN